MCSRHQRDIRPDEERTCGASREDQSSRRVCAAAGAGGNRVRNRAAAAVQAAAPASGTFDLGKPGSPAPSGQTPSAMRSAESRRRSRRGGSASKTLMPPLPPTPWPPAPRSSRQTRLTWSESRAFAWKTGPQKNADRWRACASACLPQLTRDRLAAPAKRGPSWLSTVPSPQLTRDRLAAPAAQRWP